MAGKAILETDSFVSLWCRFCQFLAIGILLAKGEGDGFWLVPECHILLYISNNNLKNIES